MNIIYFAINRNGIKIPFRTLKNANAFLNLKRKGRYFVKHQVVDNKTFNDIVFYDIVK